MALYGQYHGQFGCSVTIRHAIISMGLPAGSGLGFMHVEFFGIPRERAGIAGIDVQADTLGQLLGILVARIPRLGELVGGNQLHPAVVANLNGDRFVSDPTTPLRENDHVLILSADAGG
jgi:molybdopterin converting factor small subunit